MLAKVVIHEEGGFEAWMKKAEEADDRRPPLERGEKAFNTYGCSGCHTTDGTIKTGPSFKGLFGKTETMTDGSSVTVDENYIRQSLLEPQAKIVQGFPPSMPTFKGKLNDAKIAGIIAYIKAQK
jgi:cytochrome c oxidase subunit 2